MRILAFIEDEEVIEKILKHLGLWELKVRSLPKMKVSSVTISIDDSDFKVPFSTPSFYPDPDYPMNSYRISTLRPGALMVSISAILTGPSNSKKLRFEDQIEPFPYSF